MLDGHFSFHIRRKRQLVVVFPEGSFTFNVLTVTSSLKTVGSVLFVLFTKKRIKVIPLPCAAIKIQIKIRSGSTLSSDASSSVYCRGRRRRRRFGSIS